MSDSTDPQPDGAPENADRLARELKALYGRGPAIPPELNAAILTSAAIRLRRQRRHWRLLRWGGAAAAASIALTFALVHQYRAPNGSPVAITIREDIDRSGRVDILDAYALARHLRDGDPLNAQWDIDGDGHVDQADVDRIAQRGVALSPGRNP